MPTAGVYIVLSTLVAPALVEVGFTPMASHMFILYFGMMSMITPPVAVAAFAAASLAGTEPMRTGFAAVRFGWVAFVIPFMFIYAPSLLMQGPALGVVLAVATATFGVWIVSIGIVGYLVRPLNVLERVLFAASGIALVVPADAFRGALATDITGLVLAVALVVRELAAGRLRGFGASAPRSPGRDSR
jgi:TRAP-type uncharacterized transport system fused permease subunit